jgi:hypothetical protein
MGYIFILPIFILPYLRKMKRQGKSRKSLNNAYLKEFFREK